MTRFAIAILLLTALVGCQKSRFQLLQEYEAEQREYDRMDRDFDRWTASYISVRNGQLSKEERDNIECQNNKQIVAITNQRIRAKQAKEALNAHP